ncbi:hypothetical protein [Anabaena azotica]|uniref:Uncharacterized protein n=1 Tax=Anabaena azotica FACHB-119 TaxID=947527 RepID=A0ABR8DBX3_9NOST|nr:hypothetical protein [Anabaena azotica]MBD2504730.1 hypothetical protein [Anabaena azotica FACHB-119]
MTYSSLISRKDSFTGLIVEVLSLPGRTIPITRLAIQLALRRSPAIAR